MWVIKFGTAYCDKDSNPGCSVLIKFSDPDSLTDLSTLMSCSFETLLDKQMYLICLVPASQSHSRRLNSFKSLPKIAKFIVVYLLSKRVYLKVKSCTLI